MYVEALLARRTGIRILANVFEKIIKEEKSPEEWKDSFTLPLFKGKGDVLLCEKYRGLRLLEHGMKIWQSVEGTA